jgi:methyltransferase (TIGR00027 family)
MAADISRMAAVTAYLRAFACVELYANTKTGDSLAQFFLPPDWAASLLNPQARAQVKANVMQPGMYAYITARTAHFDEVFSLAVAEGIGQIVILGAGFDTRALRLLTPESDCLVYELDAPATQQHKRACLKKIPNLPSHKVRYGALDLREKELAALFSDLGVRRDARTLFILEGLTMYLPCETVTAIWEAIHSWSAPASRLVMDYLLDDVLAGATTRYGAAGLLEKAAGHGEPLTCGYPARGIEATLKGVGYSVQDHLRAADLTDRYLKGLDMDLTGPVSECFPNLALFTEK